MTTRKLTPAEALECLRDWCNLCMSDFDRKWGKRKTGQMVDIAVAALEEALAQKPTAAPVPSDEEIVAGFNMVDLPSNTPWAAIGRLTNVVSLLARRIGVQGVPQ